jgi:acyl carrier protein
MQKLIDIAARILRVAPERVTLESTRDTLPEWDSLAHVRMIMEIEDEFEIEIPINDIPKIRKLNDFMKYIEG